MVGISSLVQESCAAGVNIKFKDVREGNSLKTAVRKAPRIPSPPFGLVLILAFLFRLGGQAC